MKNTLRKGCLGALFFMSAVSGFSQIKVQAEDYVEAKSGGTEIATENGGATVGFFDEMGETMTYEVNIPKEGLYQISFKYLSGKDGSLRIETADGAYVCLVRNKDVIQEYNVLDILEQMVGTEISLQNVEVIEEII